MDWKSGSSIYRYILLLLVILLVTLPPQKKNQQQHYTVKISFLKLLIYNKAESCNTLLDSDTGLVEKTTTCF